MKKKTNNIIVLLLALFILSSSLITSANNNLTDSVNTTFTTNNSIKTIESIKKEKINWIKEAEQIYFKTTNFLKENFFKNISLYFLL